MGLSRRVNKERFIGKMFKKWYRKAPELNFFSLYIKRRRRIIPIFKSMIRGQITNIVKKYLYKKYFNIRRKIFKAKSLQLLLRRVKKEKKNDKKKKALIRSLNDKNRGNLTYKKIKRIMKLRKQIQIKKRIKSNRLMKLKKFKKLYKNMLKYKKLLIFKKRINLLKIIRLKKITKLKKSNFFRRCFKIFKKNAFSLNEIENFKKPEEIITSKKFIFGSLCFLNFKKSGNFKFENGFTSFFLKTLFQFQPVYKWFLRCCKRMNIIYDSSFRFKTTYYRKADKTFFLLNALPFVELIKKGKSKNLVKKRKLIIWKFFLSQKKILNYIRKIKNYNFKILNFKKIIQIFFKKLLYTKNFYQTTSSFFKYLKLLSLLLANSKSYKKFSKQQLRYTIKVKKHYRVEGFKKTKKDIIKNYYKVYNLQNLFTFKLEVKLDLFMRLLRKRFLKRRLRKRFKSKPICSVTPQKNYKKKEKLFESEKEALSAKRFSIYFKKCIKSYQSHSSRLLLQFRKTLRNFSFFITYNKKRNFLFDFVFSKKRIKNSIFKPIVFKNRVCFIKKLNLLKIKTVYKQILLLMNHLDTLIKDSFYDFNSSVRNYHTKENNAFIHYKSLFSGVFQNTKKNYSKKTVINSEFIHPYLLYTLKPNSIQTTTEIIFELTKLKILKKHYLHKLKLTKLKILKKHYLHKLKLTKLKYIKKHVIIKKINKNKITLIAQKFFFINPFIFPNLTSLSATLGNFRKSAESELSFYQNISDLTLIKKSLKFRTHLLDFFNIGYKTRKYITLFERILLLFLNVKKKKILNLFQFFLINLSIFKSLETFNFFTKITNIKISFSLFKNQIFKTKKRIFSKILFQYKLSRFYKVYYWRLRFQKQGRFYKNNMSSRKFKTQVFTQQMLSVISLKKFFQERLKKSLNKRSFFRKRPFFFKVLRKPFKRLFRGRIRKGRIFRMHHFKKYLKQRRIKKKFSILKRIINSNISQKGRKFLRLIILRSRKDFINPNELFPFQFNLHPIYIPVVEKKKKKNDLKTFSSLFRFLYHGISPSRIWKIIRIFRRHLHGGFFSNYIKLFEFRLDVLLVRLRFSKNISQGALLIKKGFIMINGRVCLSPSYTISVTDIVTIVPYTSRCFKLNFLLRLESLLYRLPVPFQIPKYFEFNFKFFSFMFLRNLFSIKFLRFYPFNSSRFKKFRQLMIWGKFDLRV